MKSLRFSLLLSLVAAVGISSAQTTRVAYVDIDRVTAKSKQVNEAMGKLEGKVKGIQEEVEAKRKRLADVKLEIRNGTGVLAESELKKRRDESTKLENDLAELELQAKREMQRIDSNFFEPMLKSIVFAIQDVAKEKKIDLVMRGEAVLYGAPVSDITDAVVEKLNTSGYTPSSGDSASSSEAGDSPTDEAKPEAASSGTAEDKPASGSDGSKTPEPSATPAPRATAPKVPATPAATRQSTRPAGTRPVDRMQD